MSFLNHKEVSTMSYINKKFNKIYNKHLDLIWDTLIYNYKSINVINCNTHLTFRYKNYAYSFPNHFDKKKNLIIFLNKIKY